MSDDTISRQAAIEAICTQGTNAERDGQYVISLATAKQRAVDILESLPTIDPVPQLKWERDTAVEQLRHLGYGFGEKMKRGRWVKLDMHPHLADHKCTACGESAYVPTCMGEPMYLFCPNCGALMREDGGEDE